jgi:hypothetical protein
MSHPARGVLRLSVIPAGLAGTGSLGVAEQRPATRDPGRNQRPATRDPARPRPGPGGTAPGSLCGRAAAQARLALSLLRSPLGMTCLRLLRV